MRRVGLPPGGSTLTTSAPRPASVSPQYSACSSASSTTRMPVSGPPRGATLLGTEGSPCASMVTLQSLSFEAVRPTNAAHQGLYPSVRIDRLDWPNISYSSQEVPSSCRRPPYICRQSFFARSTPLPLAPTPAVTGWSLRPASDSFTPIA